MSYGNSNTIQWDSVKICTFKKSSLQETFMIYLHGCGHREESASRMDDTEENM